MERFFTWLFALWRGKRCGDCLYFDTHNGSCLSAVYRGITKQSKDDKPCGIFYDKTKK